MNSVCCAVRASVCLSECLFAEASLPWRPPTIVTTSPLPPRSESREQGAGSREACYLLPCLRERNSHVF
ncbi:hypothetical protein E2C01_037507 [Portunus trituberculatus]|uniref:Uncharacterized protein n=1 Tax=Portunus trituberculatus TaxID=210409 RepID=A0A5B7FFH6_PORTR|nr:hypothetical protein [Portunus trituberculatus]